MTQTSFDSRSYTWRIIYTQHAIVGHDLNGNGVTILFSLPDTQELRLAEAAAQDRKPVTFTLPPEPHHLSVRTPEPEALTLPRYGWVSL
jgi:hypothetical protein